MATNAALIGAHQAQREINKLTGPGALLISEHINEVLIATAMGQLYDMHNEVTETTDLSLVNNALLWKTSYYTISNPLCSGVLLAGGPSDGLEALNEFGEHAGFAFQMSDDILCTFSNQQESGKPPMDDIREGKRTYLVLKTLELASKTDALFIEQMIGNQNISVAQFEKCKKIMIDCGALDETKKKLSESCQKAKRIVESSNWNQEFSDYLSGLVDFLETRKK